MFYKKIKENPDLEIISKSEKIKDLEEKIKRAITYTSNSPFKKFFKKNKYKTQINLLQKNFSKISGVNMFRNIFHIIIISHCIYKGMLT